MLKKFVFLIEYGIKKKVKSKAFIISNILIFVLLIGLLNIDSIITFFGGDFEEETTIFVLDETQNSYEIFEQNFELNKISIFEDNGIIKLEKVDKEIETLKNDILGTGNIIVYLQNDEENYMKAEIISEGFIDTLTYTTITQSINNTKYTLALQKSDINQEELIKISSPPETIRTILDESKTSDEEQMETIMSLVFPAFIFPFFFLIILLIQMIGGEINEEKTTRSMEVIISNVSPKTHFYAKLISANLFVILQTILLIVYGAIGFLIRTLVGSNSGLSEGIGTIFDTVKDSGMLDKILSVLPLTLVLMVLSFIGYSLIAGILASITTSTEDYQQIQTPIMIILMVAYMLSTLAGSFDGSTFIKVASFIPLISCLLGPSLYIIGQITLIDIAISVGIMILFIIVVTKYGLRVYKTGILNYSTDKLWSKMFKSIKSK